MISESLSFGRSGVLGIDLHVFSKEKMQVKEICHSAWSTTIHAGMAWKNT
jgi:hypothetical protein